jgi:hypothetical protein
MSAARQADTRKIRPERTDCEEKDQDLGKFRINFSVRVRQETRLYYYIRTDGLKNWRK